MSKLQVGIPAPGFSLRDVDGNAHTLEAGASPLTLAIFFKTTCPTCQYAWSFYERLHKAYSGAGLRVLGISQHDGERTDKYRAKYDATFPHLLDEGYSVSRVYDPEFVPTGFLVDGQGTIVETFESWDSHELNKLSRNVAGRLEVPFKTIISHDEKVATHKLG